MFVFDLKRAQPQVPISDGQIGRNAPSVTWGVRSCPTWWDHGLGDLVPQYGRNPFDAMLNIVTQDRLETGIETPIADADSDEAWAERRRLWADRRVVIGGSDAGAHLDMMRTFACYVTFIAEAVRKRNLLSLPDAIHLITDVPAQLYGLNSRGRIAPGYYADLLVFDLETMGPGVVEARKDLPGGGWRLYSEAVGIDHTFVNGVEISRTVGNSPAHSEDVSYDQDKTLQLLASELP